jgi:limonene-1,2-epoxide hydrolase
MEPATPQANVELLNRFYRAFAALDADTMAACYAPDARFKDEVFTLAGREEIAAMWRMLCQATQAQGRADWSLQYSDISADASQGRAYWEARYRFSATGRRVHNCINGDFRFRDGLISDHRDRFDFWSWSRQALGLPGWLLGWSPMLRRQVQAKAAARLKAFRGLAG